MKTYLVGGAVRDKLLGFPIHERDWVVVGATPQEMLDAGYKQVGKGFPVFLHPKTNEEYALARTERKIHAGYKGFDFVADATISLEEDLQRRDLTINAMAETKEGVLIDPYHGKDDLEKKILRHVSAAFAEDPVRILRIGRFLARYAYLGFEIAPETMQLMQRMVKDGEVDALVAERVWKELERALTEKNPENFFMTLNKCGAFAKLFPELSLHHIEILKKVVPLTSSALIRFAAMLHELPKTSLLAVCQRFKVPNHYKELAVLSAQYLQKALNVKMLSSSQILSLFSALDIFRRDARFKDFLTVCELLSPTEGTKKTEESPINLLLKYAKAAKSVNIQALLTQGLSGNELAAELKEKREEQIEMSRMDCYDR